MKEDSNYLKRLKRKVLITVFLLIFGLLGVVFSFLLFNEMKSTSEVEKAFNQNLKVVVEHILINHIVEEYKIRASNILSTPKIKEYLESDNREALYDLILPFWKRLTKGHKYLEVMVFHSPDGKAFLRMHKPEAFNDNLSNVREMVKAVHSSKKFLVGYETGKYSTVYRVIVPIFDEDKYIGAMDFGVNPNYFIDSLNKIMDGKGALFVDKKDLKLYKRDYDFSIGDYQLQSDVDKDTEILLNYLKESSNCDLTDDYKLEINKKYYIIHIKDLKDFKDKTKAKLVFFQDITEHKEFYNKALLYISISAWVLLIVIFIILNYSFNYLIKELQRLNDKNISREKETQKELMFRENYLQTILNSNENIIITTVEGERLDNANSAFLKFFNYKNIEDFKKEHKCICEFFEFEEGKNYVTENVNGKNWLEYILANRPLRNRVLMKKDNKNYIFRVNANLMEFDKKLRSVVNFTDITELEEYKNSLEKRVRREIEKRRRQEQLLIQQSKMSSIIEVMSSISHQWRQPLNVIGLSIQNLSMKAELEEEITPEYVNDLNEHIMAQITYMSNTIDNFRTFFRPTVIKENFDIKDSISNTISLIKAELESSDIDIEFKSNEENRFLVLGYKSEFGHILLNIILNAKDAIDNRRLIENKESEIRGFIKISLNYLDSKAIIEILDNGGGIKDELIDKIFEPYFTTKFESMGTGLGLYMAKTMIEKNMNGKIYAQNFENGTKFIIEIQK